MIAAPRMSLRRFIEVVERRFDVRVSVLEIDNGFCSVILSRAMENTQRRELPIQVAVGFDEVLPGRVIARYCRALDIPSHDLEEHRH